MKVSKYKINGDWMTSREFDDLSDAEDFARKTSHDSKEDVVIYKAHSVVKFPLDDYKVSKLD